ncbi:FG-GAP repeat domain-containing protein [Streptomyces boninensis]|uniref:FG-GAP repeat domain-containing protein n=1 Tax=Streptomyces boninensis TaxID=2039455 RepID=UPI003B21587A
MSRLRLTVIAVMALALVGANVLLYQAFWGEDDDRPIGIPGAGPGEHDRAPRTKPQPTTCEPPPRAAARPAKPPARAATGRGDFNGDGYPDVHLNAWYRPKEGGGWLHNRSLLLGSAKGPGRSVSLSTRARGLEPKHQFRDLTGSSVNQFTGDLDRDGHADLLIRTPRTDGRDRSWTDQRILWGDGKLTSPTSLRLPADRAPVQAAGDFDGNGALDLVAVREGQLLGVFYEGVARKTHCVEIQYGPFSRTGQPDHTQSFDGSQQGWLAPDESYGLFVGDFDGDRRDDLVTRSFLSRGGEDEDGPPYESMQVPAGLQDTRFYRGGREGLGLAAVPPGISGPQTAALAQDREAELRDKDRRLLCAGHFDQDRYADLLQRDGTVLHGSPAGPGPRGTKTLPAVEDDTTMGACPRVPGADLNGDGADDLITSDPDDTPAGGVLVRLSRPDGYDEALRIDRDGLKIRGGSPKFPSDEDKLGWDVAGADLDKDGYAELLIGYRGFFKPREEHGYYVIPGTADGPDLKRARFLPVRELGVG